MKLRRMKFKRTKKCASFSGHPAHWSIVLTVS